MAQAEGSFKVCGLCSQLVDESVELADDMLDFLSVFLEVDGSRLPTKICSGCFRGASESKKFRDKSKKIVDKLQKTNLTSTMILGRSAEDVKIMRAKFKMARSVPGGGSKAGKANSGKGNVGQQINASIETVFQTARGRRVNRIPSYAEVTEDMPLSARQNLKKKGLTKSIGPPVVTQSYAESDQPDFSPQFYLERPMKRKVQSPARLDMMYLNQKKIKAEPSRATATGARPGGGKGGARLTAAQQRLLEAEAEEEDMDDEEIFPSVGPYQCEICQNILDTKQEFVCHIKSLHKNQIDDEVLSSLESDLKKRKKREEREIMKKSGKGSKALPAKKKVVATKKGAKKKRKRTKKNLDLDDEDVEYVPGRNKGRRRGLTGSIDTDDSNNPMVPVDCDICGSKVSKAALLPKHQASARCQQLALMRNSNFAEFTNDDTNGANDSQGSINNDSEANGQKINGIDAKFKASIAKRYEAERVSEDGPETKGSEETSGEEKPAATAENAESAEPSSIDETEMAIQNALQESLESMKRESEDMMMGSESETAPSHPKDEGSADPGQPDEADVGEAKPPMEENYNGVSAADIDTKNEHSDGAHIEPPEAASGLAPESKDGLEETEYKPESPKPDLNTANSHNHSLENKNLSDQPNVMKPWHRYQQMSETDAEPASLGGHHPLPPPPQPEQQQHTMPEHHAQPEKRWNGNSRPGEPERDPYDSPSSSGHGATLDLSLMSGGGVDSSNQHHQQQQHLSGRSHHHPLDSLESQMAALHGMSPNSPGSGSRDDAQQAVASGGGQQLNHHHPLHQQHHQAPPQQHQQHPDNNTWPPPPQQQHQPYAHPPPNERAYYH